MKPLRTSCMSAFSRFSLFGNYKNPKWNPNRNMVICSMGPGGLITCTNPTWNPNRKLANCSMGPGDIITCKKPNETPNRSKIIFSNGLMVAGSALGVCPRGKPLVLWVKLPEGKGLVHTAAGYEILHPKDGWNIWNPLMGQTTNGCRISSSHRRWGFGPMSWLVTRKSSSGRPVTFQARCLSLLGIQ